MIDELFGLAAELDDETVAHLATMLPHALSVAFGPHLRSYDGMHSSRDDIHRARVREFASRNLRDPDLDAEVIAAAVGVSVRYLHKLFACEPRTLMRWIRKERLTRIRNELANNALSDHRIATIAYGWGFSDPAHFSRTFRAAYGVSPRDFRESVKAAPPSRRSTPMVATIIDCRSARA
jgi:AraC-like DNA-binding protein